MKNLGLKRLLILSVSLLVGLSVSISSYIQYLHEKQSVTEDVVLSSQEYVRAQSSIIETFINEKVAGLNKLAARYKDKSIEGSPEEIIEQTKVLATAFNTGSAVISFEDGNAYWNLSTDAWPNHHYKGNITEVGWYQAGQNASTVTVTDPYLGLDGKDYWLTAIEKIKGGAIAIDLKLEFLADMVKETTKIPGAVAFILNSDTTILASSSPALSLGKKANTYDWLAVPAKKAITQKSTMVEYQLNGDNKIFFSHRINAGDKEWVFCLGVNEAVVFAKLDESANAAIITGIIAVIASIVAVLMILQLLYRPILALKQTVLDLSSGNGDLTQRLEVHTSDDLGQISQGINRFIENLQNMMLEIQDTTINLQSHVDGMHQQSARNDEMLQSHVAETEQVVTAIEEMNSTANSMATDAANTAEITQRANEVGNESHRIAQQSQDTISELINDVDSAVDSVNEMSEKTQGINSILDVISGIAEQTNLLALNAAIEAARAGEHGRGFAVVADEVRNLASRTKDSTEEVETALESLLQGTQVVATSMDNTKARCEETVTSSGEVAESLDSMSSFVNEIHGLSAQIATAAEEQSSVTQELTRNMSEINSIVRELEGHGQQAVKDADNIANLNNHLSEIVGRFKL